jgi:hypothetical protein
MRRQIKHFLGKVIAECNNRLRADTAYRVRNPVVLKSGDSPKRKKPPLRQMNHIPRESKLWFSEMANIPSPDHSSGLIVRRTGYRTSDPASNAGNNTGSVSPSPPTSVRDLVLCTQHPNRRRGMAREWNYL